MTKIIKIKAPTDCIIGELSKVPDPIFSSKAMGDGVVISPLNGNFVSPVSGVVDVVFPTGHAYIIDCDGLKVMIHIGIDTIKLEGEGFKSIVKPGDKVKAGKTKIAEIDLASIEKVVPSLITPILAIEHSNGVVKDVIINYINTGKIKSGEEIAFLRYKIAK